MRLPVTRLLRWLGKTILTILLIVILLIGILPTLISINATRNFLLIFTTYVSEYTLTIGSASIGWFSPVEIKKVVAIDQSGTERFKCEEFKTDKTLLQLALNPNDLGNAVIISPKIVLQQESVEQEFNQEEFNQTADDRPEKTHKKTVKTKKNGQVSSKISSQTELHTPPKNADINEPIAISLPVADIDVQNGVVEFIPLDDSMPPRLQNIAFKLKSSPEHVDLSLSADAITQTTSKVLLQCTVDMPTADGISSLFNHLFSKEPQKESNSRINWNLQVKQLDLGLLKALGKSTNFMPLELAQPILGNSINVVTTGNIDSKNCDINLKVDSQDLQMNLTAVKKENFLVVDGKDLLFFTLTPKSFEALRSLCDFNGTFDLKENSSFKVSIDPVTFPLPLQLNNIPDFSLVSSTVTPISLVSESVPLPLSIQSQITCTSQQQNIAVKSNSSFQYGAKSAGIALNSMLNKDILTLNCQTSGPWQAVIDPFYPDIAKSLGSNFSLMINGEGSLDHFKCDATLNTQDVTASGSSNDFNLLKRKGNIECQISRLTGVPQKSMPIKIIGKLLTDNSLGIEAASPSFKLTVPEFISKNTSEYLLPNPATLVLKNDFSTAHSPFEITLTVQPFSIDCKNMTGKVPVLIETSDIVFKTFPALRISSINTFDLSNRKADLQFYGKQVGKGIDILDASCVVTLPKEFKHSSVETIGLDSHIQLNQVPTFFLPKDIQTLVGENLSGHVRVWFDTLTSDKNSFEGFFKGDGCDLHFNLASKRNNGLSIVNGSSQNALVLDYQMTNERLAILKPGIKLQSPLPFNITLSQINIPLINKETLPELLDLTTCSACIETGLLKGTVLNSDISFAPLKCLLNLKAKTRDLSFSIDSQTKEGSEIYLKGRVNNLWNEKIFTPEKSTIECQGTIQDLPLQLFEATKPLGESMNVTLEGKISSGLNGNVKLTTRAERFHANADVKLQAGTVTINSPLEVFFSISPELGKSLLLKANPLLASAVRSKSEIKLRIEPEGFRLPLSPFNIQTIQCRKAILDLGQIKVKSGGILETILVLLRGDVGSKGEFDLWCTPIYLDMNGGVINCSRADFLVGNKIHLCTWGTINLSQDKLNLFVGIPSKTLEKSLLVYGLPKDFVMQIPITGSPSSPYIDQVRATAKIAGLGVQGKTLDPAVSIIGGLVYAAAAYTEKEGKVPPLTTNPLPWSDN